MSALPASVAESPLSQRLLAAGLIRIHQGKVRDTYAVPGYDDLLLVVATNRISVFDFVLPFLVPRKGEVLTALTVFWLTEVFRDYPNHLIAYGAEIDQYLPQPVRKHAELRRSALVVRKLQMIPIECIARGYLTGSGLEAYNATGEVCGIKLPPGLHDGSLLPQPIFTPTTKAVEGHDEHLNADSVTETYGQRLVDLTLELYMKAAMTTKQRRIIMPDTKFEFGIDPTSPSVEIVLGDEVATPDSSRFWAVEDYDRAQERNKSPSGYDKQPVRDAMAKIETPFGVVASKLKPENREHIAWVHNVMKMPQDVIDATAPRYVHVFERLVGEQLDSFQFDDMNTDD